MSDDLPDETSSLYSYFKRLDRRVIRLRHKASTHLSGVSLSWFLVVFLFLIPSLAILGFVVQRTGTTHILLGGVPGSLTADLAPKLQAILSEPNTIERVLHLNIVPDFEVEPSCGALDTVAKIKAGVAQLGFAEDGLPSDSFSSIHCPHPLNRAAVRPYDNKPQMRVLTLLYKSPLHVLARAGKGFKRLQDLPPGTKVYLGPSGSATRFVAQRIVEHFELAVDDQTQFLDFNQAAQALTNGKIDVAFFLTGLQSSVVKVLFQQNDDVRLLPIEQTESLKILFPYLEPLTLPAAIYPKNVDAVQTVGTNTALVASTELPESEVYEIMEKIAAHAHDLLKDVPLNMARHIDNDLKKELLYQVHDGASRFVAHNPPFFMDLRTFTAVGTYFSAVYAVYLMMLQFLRHYRVHRILLTVDRLLNQARADQGWHNPQQLIPHLRQVRRITLRLMRRRKITYDEFSRVEDYISAHRL